MPELTLVISPERDWTVWRVRTLSSEYLLGVFSGGPGRRPCAVLRGLSRGLGQVIDLQDSAPLVGGKSLFEVPASEWLGKSIEMGTATTSPIQAVEREHDPAVIAALTRAVRNALPDSAREPEPSREGTPSVAALEQEVVRLEQAAKLLRGTYEAQAWRDLLDHRPDLAHRMKARLEDCLLLIDAIQGKMRR